MARHPSNNVIELPPQPEPLARDIEALDMRAAHSSAIAQQWDEGRTYHRERLCERVTLCLSSSAEMMLEAGKALLVLKENELHGDFTDLVEKRFGLSIATAERMMKASLKFCRSPKSSSMTILGKTKLYDLMILDDEEIDELAKGGTIRDMHLDDIQRMSTRELRESLRKTRDKLAEMQEDHERLLIDKNKKIDQLAVDLAKAQKKALDETIDETEHAALANYNELADRIKLDLQVTLASRIMGVFNAMEERGERPSHQARLTMGHALAEIIELCKEHGRNFSLPLLTNPNGDAGPL